MWSTIEMGTPDANIVKSQGSAHSSVVTPYWSASATSCGSWYLRAQSHVTLGRHIMV